MPRATPQPEDPLVVLHTSAGDLKLRLFAGKSPQTVDNFLRNYVSRGFYDQTIFHHVEPGSMLIGGGYTVELEAKPPRVAIYNESRNDLTNRRGTVAMIRDPEVPHSANSQFFINLADNPHLDFQNSNGEELFGYCVFGEVVEGMEAIDRIAHLPTTSRGDFASVPSPAVVIQSVERIR
jgi:cyclophilin family peptidyl-prolyl cis-trans isomerase